MHRLGIPWRNADGTIATIQRRRIDAGERKYVFPRSRGARLPFGVESLAGAPTDAAIAYAEGALDVLALRLLATREGRTFVPLGVPGVENWRTEWARFATGRLAIVALDADNAGEGKRDKLRDDLFAANAHSVERWTPNGARDWAELVERGAA